MHSSLAVLALSLLAHCVFANASCAYTAFPAGSCRAQRCAADNPYVLVPTSPYAELRGAADRICFRVEPRGCDPAASECCGKLQNVLEKIALKVRPGCGRASVSRVTINNRIKGGGVYLEECMGFAELRVTALRWNVTTSIGKTVCIELRPPCATVDQFCMDNT